METLVVIRDAYKFLPCTVDRQFWAEVSDTVLLSCVTLHAYLVRSIPTSVIVCG